MRRIASPSSSWLTKRPINVTRMWIIDSKTHHLHLLAFRMIYFFTVHYRALLSVAPTTLLVLQAYGFNYCPIQHPAWVLFLEILCSFHQIQITLLIIKLACTMYLIVHLHCSTFIDCFSHSSGFPLCRLPKIPKSRQLLNYLRLSSYMMCGINYKGHDINFFCL
jgi:hypothetical protein